MSKKETVSTPTDYHESTSTSPSGKGHKINGEPGLPERTSSKHGVEEVSYDSCGGRLPGKGKS